MHTTCAHFHCEEKQSTSIDRSRFLARSLTLYLTLRFSLSTETARYLILFFSYNKLVNNILTIAFHPNVYVICMWTAAQVHKSGLWARCTYAQTKSLLDEQCSVFRRVAGFLV